MSQTLFQYGRTKGIVHELIARELAADEGISDLAGLGRRHRGLPGGDVHGRCARCARTSGTCCSRSSPAYVGLTGAARLADLPVWPVRSGGAGIDLDDLAAQAQRARQAGLRPRACYVMPDFANPTGLSLTVRVRQRLLEVAAGQGVLLLEDNPYGLFHDGAHRARRSRRSTPAARSSTWARSPRPGFPAPGSATRWPTRA